MYQSLCQSLFMYFLTVIGIKYHYYCSFCWKGDFTFKKLSILQVNMNLRLWSFWLQIPSLQYCIFLFSECDPKYFTSESTKMLAKIQVHGYHYIASESSQCERGERGGGDSEAHPRLRTTTLSCKHYTQNPNGSLDICVSYFIYFSLKHIY